jgi:hypothetical protein
VVASFLLFGIANGAVNTPITNTAVAGMPPSMAGLAASLASSGRQTGITLGVAISGTIVGPALARGGTALTDPARGVAFTDAARGVWWLVAGVGVAVVGLALLATRRRAYDSAARAADLFDSVSTGTR